MKRYLSTVGILLTFQILCLSQGNESFKYIWAKGGMNLRQHPKVTSKIISKVPYGDSLIILNTTSIGLANLLVKAGKKRNRLLLQSHWVEVVVNNVRGYMIDGFLLDYPCPKKNESLTNYLDRMEIKIKDNNEEESFKMEFGIARFECYRMSFPNGHKVVFKNQNHANEVYKDHISSKRNYHGFSTSKLIVFLDPFYNILSSPSLKLKVSSNWKKYLDIWDGVGESIEFTFLDEGSIIMDLYCY